MSLGCACSLPSGVEIGSDADTGCLRGFRLYTLFTLKFVDSTACVYYVVHISLCILYRNGTWMEHAFKYILLSMVYIIRFSLHS